MILVQCNHLPHNTLPHMSGITAKVGALSTLVSRSETHLKISFCYQLALL